MVLIVAFVHHADDVLAFFEYLFREWFGTVALRLAFVESEWVDGADRCGDVYRLQRYATVERTRTYAGDRGRDLDALQ